MGIGRLLVIAGLVWFVVMLYRRYRLHKQRRGPHKGKLIRCAKCGVYLPEHEAKPGADNAPVCAHHRAD